MDTKSFLKTKHNNIKVHKDGLTYLLDFRANKQRYRKQIQVNNIEEALRALNEFKQQKIKEQTIEADFNSTVEDYFNKLKIVRGWSKELVYNYEKYFDKHLSKIASIKIVDIKPMHFTSLNISLNHMARASQRKAYEILDPLFNLAIEDELIEKNPIKRSHIPKRKSNEEKHIIDNASIKFRYLYETINILFGSTDIIEIGSDKIQCVNRPDLRATFLFGFYGRRLNEVLTLRWNDIDRVNKTYTIRAKNSKVNTDMVFQLPRDIEDVLSDIDHKRMSQDEIFKVKFVKDYYPRVRLHSGIEDFSFHHMRNLLVSALASEGVDVTHLSSLLGHQDGSTLKKYLSLQRTASTKVTNDAVSYLISFNDDFK